MFICDSTFAQNDFQSCIRLSCIPTTHRLPLTITTTITNMALPLTSPRYLLMIDPSKKIQGHPEGGERRASCLACKAWCRMRNERRHRKQVIETIHCCCNCVFSSYIYIDWYMYVFIYAYLYIFTSLVFPRTVYTVLIPVRQRISTLTLHARAYTTAHRHHHHQSAPKRHLWEISLPPPNRCRECPERVWWMWWWW